ncbi:MAG: hypothetical protein KDK38_13735, partial [Leptospiraceae bacterium]|nr:hypothetical protein [Leptospiraceae bacterium]
DYDFDPDDETDADSIESDQTDEWSASLKEMTREILYEMPIANFHMGYCMLKSLDDQYGLITIGDVSADRYIIRNTENKSEISRFDSIDELLKAGWVID